MDLRRHTQRGNLPSITRPMMDALQQLAQALEDDSPFLPLAEIEIHTQTVWALVDRDWIFESPGLDGIRIKITGRGLKALRAYERPTKRFDGLCPDCGKKPRMVGSTGYVYGYCVDCQRKYGNRRAERYRKTRRAKQGQT